MPVNLITSEMNKCLQLYNLSTVFQEEMKCLNSPVTTEMAKSTDLPHPPRRRESPSPGGSTVASSSVSRYKVFPLYKLC